MRLKVNTKSIIYLVILAVVIYGAVFVLNKGNLDKVSAQRITITPENVVATKDINFGDVVEITGTPDLLNAVSMEDKDDAEIFTYYVPFKEYGTNYVVQMRKTKLRSEQQTFAGIATGLVSTAHENRIRNRLNRPVELTDQDRVDLDPDTIEILTNQTTNEFTSKTILIQDEKLPSADQVYASIAFWGTLAFLGVATVFRRTIFS